MARIIAFWGKDGSGKSTVVSNVAATLAVAGHIVGVVGTRLNYGSLQHYFGIQIKEQKSITEAIENFDDLDIKQRFVQHPKQNNLFILSLANTHNCLYKTELQDGEEKFIENLKNIDAIDYILIDCGESVNDILSAFALVNADKVIYMFKPDIQNNAFLAAHTELIGSIPGLVERMAYVCSNNKNYIDLKSLQGQHHIEFYTVLPYCKDVEIAANEGAPFSERFTGTFADKLFGKEQYLFADGINKIAVLLTKEEGQEGRK